MLPPCLSAFHYRIGLLTRVIEKSALIALARQSVANNERYLSQIAEQCDRLLRGESLSPQPLPANAPAPLREVHSKLRQYTTVNEFSQDDPASIGPELARPSSSNAGLFLPNVFQTGAAVTYALKLTLAATICYIFYSAIDWPGILTCVVTVLFTGLSSTGAMKQKQLYRFSGAAIGGVLGIATVSLLFPNMDSITSLTLVVGAVAFLSAWTLRSPRMRYVGVQIGFAFFLTTLPGFSATTLIAPARDRVIGIAAGILVMWFIFDQLWPVRTSTALSQVLRRIQESGRQLQHALNQCDSAMAARTEANLRAAVSLEFAVVQQLESAAHFDVGRGHKRELAASRRLIRQIESAADFYLEALRVRDLGLPHPS
jgi:multidrug resistance protein MdtO